MISTLFFFNDTATTEIYTLSLHDALPISKTTKYFYLIFKGFTPDKGLLYDFKKYGYDSYVNDYARYITTRYINYKYKDLLDRKSTRLNSSHANISYAVFCLKKKILSILSI